MFLKNIKNSSYCVARYISWDYIISAFVLLPAFLLKLIFKDLSSGSFLTYDLIPSNMPQLIFRILVFATCVIGSKIALDKVFFKDYQKINLVSRISKISWTIPLILQLIMEIIALLPFFIYGTKTIEFQNAFMFFLSMFCSELLEVILFLLILKKFSTVSEKELTESEIKQLKTERNLRIKQAFLVTLRYFILAILYGIIYYIIGFAIDFVLALFVKGIDLDHFTYREFILLCLVLIFATQGALRHVAFRYIRKLNLTSEIKKIGFRYSLLFQFVTSSIAFSFGILLVSPFATGNTITLNFSEFSLWILISEFFASFIVLRYCLERFAIKKVGEDSEKQNYSKHN